MHSNYYCNISYKRSSLLCALNSVLFSVYPLELILFLLGFPVFYHPSLSHHLSFPSISFDSKCFFCCCDDPPHLCPSLVIFHTLLLCNLSLIGLLWKGALRNMSFDYECAIHIWGESEWGEGKSNNLPDKETIGKTEKENLCFFS